VLSQLDIREFQKALAAVRTGWEILLSKAGLEASDVRLVFIAGSFGSSIDVRDLIDLQIAPTDNPRRILYAGNMVLSGLRVMLLESGAWSLYKDLLQRIEHVNPAEEKGYMELWIRNLNINPKMHAGSPGQDA
jgi:uncharacterized 2Fe-2S/4Fe-4S cluster protein (DUF4445 family)